MVAALQPVHLALLGLAVLLTAIPWYRPIPRSTITGKWPRARTILLSGLVLLCVAGIWEWLR